MSFARALSTAPPPSRGRNDEGSHFPGVLLARNCQKQLILFWGVVCLDLKRGDEPHSGQGGQRVLKVQLES